jgi:hypothetical protein
MWQCRTNLPATVLPAELTLNEKGDAITGTLIFSKPLGSERIQVPISSGVASKDAVTFSGQNQFPMASIEITLHGKLNGTTLARTADMTQIWQSNYFGRTQKGKPARKKTLD